MRRYAVLLLILLVIATAGLFGYTHYQSNYQTIEITSSSKHTFALYPAIVADESNEYVKSELIFSTSEPEKFRVKRGEYVYVVSGPGSDYKPVAYRISISKQPVKIDIPEIDFTDKKLAELTQTERSKIETSLNGKYPVPMSDYSINTVKLYKNGQWAGVKLVPNNPAAHDVLRAVLKKNGSAWNVITDPPEIVISQPVYQEIPLDILTDLNKL
jgi:hypothetical protein